MIAAAAAVAVVPEVWKRFAPSRGFSRQAWYRSDPDYEDSRLTAIDTHNVAVLMKAEK
jgi:hypothetical protein